MLLCVFAKKEGVVYAFGVSGTAINPLYSALKKRGSINHTEIATSSNSNRPPICRSMSRRCFRRENFCRREALDSELFQRNRS